MMNRKWQLLSTFRFAKALLLSTLLVAALSLSACSDNNDCEGDDCDTGPVDCTSNNECDLGTYCGPDFMCIEDPCKADTCERGSCQRGSTMCTGAAGCEEETADVDCVFGEICQLGNCLNEERYCDALACERGVCNFDEQKCVPATDCAGDSDLCMGDNYCNSMDQCAPDLCKVNNVECADGGVCIPSLGECSNPDQCTSSNDCLDEHLCVLESGSLGTCLLRDTACGDGPGDRGCYGNKTCDYDSVSLLATCQEISTCQNALDCNDGRQCVGRSCEEAVACEDDDFEPNNSESEATDFHTASSNGVLSGSICAGDSDYFLVDALSLSEGLTEGALLIDLQYEQRDVGLGEVELEVLDPDGVSLAVETSGRLGIEGSAAALVRLSTIAQGNYLVRATSGDDMAEAGVRYSMSASFSSVETQEACMNAVPLIPDASPVSGNTSAGTSTAIGSHCAGADNAAPEMIYSFELSESSAVNIEVTPNSSSTKLTASVRSACSLASSEVACQADVSDADDTLSPLLEPGIYYLIVQGINGSQGGGFKVSLGLGAVECTPATDRCIDEDTASVCLEAGTRLEEVHCAAGCDTSINGCTRVEGDLCSQAIEKDEDFTATINWEDYRPDMSLSPGGDSCVPAHNGENHTGGPDAVWAVTIPADKTLDATLTFADGEFGSMYIMDSCDDPSSSCLVGANRGNVSTERIGYANETGADEIVYLVADRSPDDPMTESTLIVELLDQDCSQNDASICNADGNIESCNAWGTQFDVSTDCDFGCTDDPDGGDATCNGPTNDTCADPLTLTDGMSVTAKMSDYTAQHDQSCTSSGNSGRDAAYMVTVTEPNTRVKVTIESNFAAVLYATTSCSMAEYETCLDSNDRNKEINFTAPTAGDYYIFAAETSNSTDDREFKITATVTAPSCTAGETLSCAGVNSVEVCDADGFPTLIEYCRAACVDGACVIEEGDTCEDPLPLAAGSTVTGDTGPFYPDYNLSADSCTGSNTPGSDVVYQIETTAPGQIIEITLDADFDSALFVSRECVAPGGAPTCLAGDDRGASQNEHVIFVAHEAGTYYVYVAGSKASEYGTYSLTADVRTPECSPGAAQSCDGDKLEFCGPLGEFVNHTCSSTCSNGACDDPSGDVCQEPIVVAHGETVGGVVNGSGSTNNVELNSGKNNQCLNGSSKTNGKEDIYRVDLLAGELLTVEMTSAKEPLVTYISESCVAASQKCHAVDSNGKDGLLHYYAEDDGSVFVIVDAIDLSRHDYQFTVDINASKACEPGGYRCLDDDTLEICNADGTEALGEYICAQGCSAGACVKVDEADVCGNAPNIGGVEPPDVGTGISVQANFGDLSNSITIPADGCTRAEGKGSDLIYKVDLGVNDVLEARVTSPTGESPMVYILTSCADTDTCLTGDKAKEGLNSKEEAFTRYLSDSVQTVYVVADSADSNASDRFRFDISVSPAECLVSDSTCLDADHERFCDQGRYNEQRCMYGSCSGNNCTGAAPDTCANAQVVPNDGQVHTYKGLLEDLNNSINLDNPRGECSEVGPTLGVDAIYAITLNPNEFLQVKVDSPADTIIWIAESCDAGMDATCSEAIDKTGTGGSETILFDARFGGTYYIVVDSASMDVSEGEYTVEIEVRGDECRLGDSECVDSSTSRSCNRYRLWEETECRFGCGATGVCEEVVGDTCDDAIVVPDDNQPHTFTGLMQDYSKKTDMAAHTPRCSGITGGTNGAEIFYAVEANAGDVIDIEWDAPRDGQLWISSSCDSPTDLLTQCIIGTDTAPEKITYVAQESRTYYIVGDNYLSTGNDGDFEMRIHVQVPECDNTSYVPECIDANTFQTCNSLGVYKQEACACEDDACLTGCDGAADITTQAASSGGATFTGAYQDYENEFDNYCGESNTHTYGRDIFYKVDLEVGQTVDVTVVSSSVTYPLISFVKSCVDLDSNPSSACFQPPSWTGTSTNNSTYTATQAGPVIILIDNDYPSGRHTFEIDIAIN